MLKTFKYRLYTTKKQSKSLELQLDEHRWLYNHALAERKETYEKAGENINYTAQAISLPKLRLEKPMLALCNYSSLQQTLKRLDKSFKAFFRRVKAAQKAGYPRFKPSHRFNTISFATIGDGCQIKDNRLYLQHIGHIKIKWHRPLPLDGEIKTLSISRRNDKWYVSFIVGCEPKPLPKTGKEIGIDVGLKAFLSTSDGVQIMPPKYFRKSEKELAKSQKRLSRRKKGSNRRNKARLLLAKKYEHIANCRLDFCHKVAHSLVNSYDGFGVEALNIKNMVKNRHLSKSISDASWGIFLRILKGKAESADRWYKEVSANGTSQRCSNCGVVVKKSLDVRIHVCPSCNLIIDRDINAAKNIFKQARMEPSALTTKFVVPPRSCRL